MNSMEMQKDDTDDEPISSVGVREIALERINRLGQSGNDAQLWLCLVVKVKSNDEMVR